MDVDLFLRPGVDLFQENHAEILTRKSVKMCQCNNAKKFHSNNVQLNLRNNVEMFQKRLAQRNQEKHAQILQCNNATQYQENLANLFHRKSARKPARIFTGAKFAKIMGMEGTSKKLTRAAGGMVMDILHIYLIKFKEIILP